MTEPPVVFDAVAVSEANTEELTSAAPPIDAEATMATFATMLPVDLIAPKDRFLSICILLFSI